MLYQKLLTGDTPYHLSYASIEKSEGFEEKWSATDASGFKVYFKNKYGVWVHPMIKI